MRIVLPSILLACPLLASAQLSVSVLPAKVTGQKAIVPLTLKNDFAEKIESARAVVFLLDERGKVMAQGTQWVIGGGQDKPRLSAGATNSFHFVVSGDAPFRTTNITAKISFNRVILEGGKLADPFKDVIIGPEKK